MLTLTFAFVAWPSRAEEPATTGICSVRRERYVPHPAPGVAPDVVMTYVGGGLRRREVHSTQSRSDIAATMSVRYSEDNGRTWSPFERLPGSEDLKQDGNGLEQLYYAAHFDAASGRTMDVVYQTIFLGDVAKALAGGFRGKESFFSHAFYRLSTDVGRTWTDLRQLTYEKGPAFNPTNWAAPGFLRANQGAVGSTILSLADGRVAIPVSVPVRYEEDDVDKQVCARVPWMDAEKGFVSGVLCFFGTWNAQKKDFDWTHSEPVSVRRYVSTRGLLEPALAQLDDGALLLEMRGGNDRLDPTTYPGRRWISQSRDGGKTWSTVTDLRYDGGEPFYSPSAFSRMLRSSKTKKLYWVGNICAQPPKGNSPRFPLYIAEIDERNIALKKSTLTIIDDRGPTDTSELQLSNFSLVENRETKDLELFLTRYGERADSVYSADVYKYTLVLFDST